TRRLVALHDGLLTVDSQLGKGSTFHVYLPLPSLNGNTAPTSISNEIQPSLFLISNKSSISPEIIHFCQQQSLDIHKLGSIDDVDRAFREGLPSTIAWDFDPSGEEDWEILQHLHTHPALCEVPFLLFGRGAQEEPAAVTNILLKPFKPKTLLGLINEMYS